MTQTIHFNQNIQSILEVEIVNLKYFLRLTVCIYFLANQTETWTR